MIRKSWLAQGVVERPSVTSTASSNRQDVDTFGHQNTVSYQSSTSAVMGYVNQSSLVNHQFDIVKRSHVRISNEKRSYGQVAASVSPLKSPTQAPATAVDTFVKRLVNQDMLSISTFIVTVLMIVGTLQMLALITVEANRWLEARSTLARLDADMITLNKQVADVTMRLEHYNDGVMLEQLARQQGFIFPDELRVVTLPE